MKKFLFFAIIIASMLFVTSCNSDDDMGPGPDEEVLATATLFEFQGSPQYDDDEGTITLTFNIKVNNPSSEALSIQARYPNQGGTTIVGGEFNSTGEFQKIESISAINVQGGTTVFELSRLDTQTGTWVSLMSLDEDFSNDSTDPIGSAEYEVKLGDISQQDGETLLQFSSNSYSGGQLKATWWLNGVVIGEEATGTLIGENGYISVDPGVTLEQGKVYSVEISNIDISNPDYKFLDQDGDVIVGTGGNPRTSLVIYFETTSDVQAEMVSHSFESVTPHSFQSVAQISVSEMTNVTIKLYKNGVEISSTTEMNVSGTQNLTTSFPLETEVIDPETTYTVMYFIGESPNSFFTTSVTTLNQEEYTFTFVNVDQVTPNSGDVHYTWTNNSGSNVQGQLVMSSLKDDGSTYEDSYNVTLSQGTSLVGSQITTGHAQGKAVHVEFLVSNIVTAETNFTTELINYTNVELLNANGTSIPIEVSSNQSSTLESKLSFDANGTDVITAFDVIITCVAGHPATYLDNIKIANSQVLDVSTQSLWTNLGNHQYKFNVQTTENIMSSNLFNIFLGANSFTPANAITGDEFSMVIHFKDGANNTTASSELNGKFIN